MKNYGFINNLGELKLIQSSIYKGDGYFVGVTRNGWAYIHTGTETRLLNKEEIASILNLTPEQVDSVIRSRGKVDFNPSKNNGAVTLQGDQKSLDVKKFETKQQVRAENKDTQMGREMSDAKASVAEASEVESSVDFSGSVSLDQSALKALSLKNQVKYVKNRLKWLEENYVSKDQMIEIVQSLLQGK